MVFVGKIVILLKIEFVIYIPLNNSNFRNDFLKFLFTFAACNYNCNTVFVYRHH